MNKDQRIAKLAADFAEAQARIAVLAGIIIDLNLEVTRLRQLAAGANPEMDEWEILANRMRRW
jgi:hypothetical protein